MCAPTRAEVSNILFHVVFREQMRLKILIIMIPDISEKSVRFARRAFRVQEVEKFEKLHG
jgi:hypothetical protein